MRASPLALLALLAAGAAGARGGFGRVDLDGDLWNVDQLYRAFEGLPRKVVLRDPIAFVALDTGLATYDVSDPRSPLPLDHLYLPSVAYDLALDGNLAHVAAGEWGLTIVDVSDPTALTVLGSLPLLGTQRAVAVAAGIAYLGEAAEKPIPTYGLHTVDVSDPRAPRALAFVTLPNGVLDIALAGSVAWVGLGSNPGRPGLGLLAVDVADPRAPSLVPGGFLDLRRPVNEVALSGGTAYLAAGLRSAGALVVAGVAVAGAPVLRHDVAIKDQALGLSLSGGTAWVAARSLGLLAFDISGAGTPRLISSLPTGRETVAVFGRGDVALLAERASIERAALTAVDTLDPAAMRELSCEGFSEATGVAVGGGLGLWLRRDALAVVDASDPRAPVTLGTWRPAKGDLSAVDGGLDLAAVAEGRTVHLVDLADPANPVEAGQVAVTLGPAVRVLLQGSTLFVSSGLGLEIFDISSLSAPVALATYAASGWLSSLAIDGGNLFLAEGDRVVTLDVSAPASPVVRSSLVIAGERLQGVAVSGTLLATTGLANTLYAVDVANAAAPSLLGVLAGGSGFDVRLEGTHALIAAGEDGVRIADLADPANPSAAGAADLPGAVYSLAHSGATLFAAAEAGQLWVLGCAACVSGCVETWPSVAANSLKFGRIGREGVLEWRIGSGSGAVNLHRTAAKAELAALETLPGTVSGVTASTRFADGVSPALPAGELYYRVFGRGACSGTSHP